MSKTIGAARFKEQCLALIDSVDADGITITKHGKPVARLVRIESRSAELIGSLADKLVIKGDVLSTGARWDAQP
ncbi:MAG: type II toxin-antitoxin system prevent-host-death family antitoxin [Longimicrobiales bacterium]